MTLSRSRSDRELLGLMAHGPSLSEEDVRVVIAFAAASAEEDLPVPGLPSGL